MAAHAGLLPVLALGAAVMFGTAAGTDATADLSVTLSGPASGSAGATLAYTATITNLGPDPAPGTAARTVLQVLQPLAYQAATATGQAVCEQLFYDGGSEVRCGYWNLAPGESRTVTLTFSVISEQASIVSIEGWSPLASDPNPANNGAAVTVNRPPSPLPPGGGGIVELPRPRLTSTSLPPAYAGEPYVARIAIEGGTPPYRVSSCYPPPPSGLVIGEDGSVTGMPHELGTFRLCVQVQDAGRIAVAGDVTIEVIRRAPLVVMLPRVLRSYAGRPFELRVASGGHPPYSAHMTGLSPVGLEFEPLTGALRGTPKQSGPFLFTLSVADAGGARASTRVDMFLRARPGFVTTPHPELTPGVNLPAVRRETVAATICSRRWRREVSSGAARPRLGELLRRYGLPAAAPGYVADRLIPVELGGAAGDVRNQWPALAAAASAYASAAERLRTRVCAGRVSLAAARREIRGLKRIVPARR